MSEKKVDIDAILRKAEAPKPPYSAIDAVTILEDIVINAMSDKRTVRDAIESGDFVSSLARKRVGKYVQDRFIDIEALRSVLSAIRQRRQG